MLTASYFMRTLNQLQRRYTTNRLCYRHRHRCARLLLFGATQIRTFAGADVALSPKMIRIKTGNYSKKLQGLLVTLAVNPVARFAAETQMKADVTTPAKNCPTLSSALPQKAYLDGSSFQTY